MSKQPEYGPWIIWNGGKCPVDGGALVQIHMYSQSRDSAEENDTDYACDLMWDITDRSSAIIAYRILREPVKETRDYANVWGCYFGPEVAPMFAENQVSENFVKGTVTTNIVDGKPVRSLWVADTESDT